MGGGGNFNESIIKPAHTAMKLKLHIEREQEERYKLLYELASKIPQSIFEIIVKK